MFTTIIEFLNKMAGKDYALIYISLYTNDLTGFIRIGDIRRMTFLHQESKHKAKVQTWQICAFLSTGFVIIGYRPPPWLR